jgi:predicted Rossmann fold nucleotide-binding protein DprA/Smf involved in DNA uptake
MLSDRTYSNEVEAYYDKFVITEVLRNNRQILKKGLFSEWFEHPVSMARIAIVGYRGFNDRERFDTIMFQFDHILKEASMIVSGGADGVDTLAREWALKRGFTFRMGDQIPQKEFVEYLPQYDKYPGHVAPLIRNEQIVDAVDVVIALVSSRSRGTLNTIKHAQKQGKIVYTVRID